MVLCYFNYVPCISDYPMKTMKGVQRTLKLKDDNIDEPEDYLGATLENMILSYGSECWSMSSAKYVKSAVKNIMETLAKYEKILTGRCVAPL